MRRDLLMHVALVAVLGLYASEFLRAWPELPDRVASHFDGSGAPNGWMSREGFVAVGGLVGALMAFLGWGVGALLRRVPTAAINVPHREYWLAPERREATVERVRVLVQAMAVATTALLWLVMRDVLAFNLGERADGVGPELAWQVGAYLLGVGVWVWSLLRGFRLPADAGAA